MGVRAAHHHREVGIPGGEIVGPRPADDEPGVLLAATWAADLGRGAVVDDGRDWPPAHGAGALLHSLDDVVVAGAPAEVALKPFADLGLGGVGVLGDEVDRLHDHPGCRSRTGGRGSRGRPPASGAAWHRWRALDRRHLVPVGLDGEQLAGLHTAAVEVHRARTAVAGVAAHHGPDLAEPISEVLHEQRARLDVVGISSRQP